MVRESCLHNFDKSLRLSLELQNKLSQKDTKRLQSIDFKMIMPRYWYYGISMGVTWYIKYHTYTNIPRREHSHSIIIYYVVLLVQLFQIFRK